MRPPLRRDANLKANLLPLRMIHFMWRTFLFFNEAKNAMNATTAAMLDNATLTPREVQVILRASRSTVYRGLNSGTIPSFRINKTVMIPAAWLRALLTVAA